MGLRKLSGRSRRFERVPMSPWVAARVGVGKQDSGDISIEDEVAGLNRAKFSLW